MQTWTFDQDCSSCNNVGGWVFLNETWQAETNALRNAPIQSNNSAAYCHQSLGFRYLFLENFDYNLDIYPYANASLAANSLCEWRIVNLMNEKVTLTINRDPKGYEELLVDIYTGTERVYYQTKDLSNWNSNTAIFEFEGAINFILKALKVNEDSNYTINVRQQGHSDDDELWILIICSFAITIMVTIFVGIMIILWIYYKTQPQQRRRRIAYTQEEKDFRNEYIQKSLNNIGKQEFKNIRAKFEQNSCIICLNDFEPHSEVCITNECNHVFHFVCLREWFKNITISRDLTCPHCNTVITDTSRPAQNSVESDSAEVIETSEVLNIPDENSKDNQHANYVGLISSSVNQASRIDGRETRDDCIIANQYEDI